ncbi:MAG: hypothetical protein U9O64_07760 [Campylobacterota bacterium]|nr:hypothetical protein [Campylobacterota bacterium]
MYYILNETDQIIAADDKLLKLCGVSHIDQLSLNIALGEIKFDLSNENMILTHNSSDRRFSMTKTSLSSMLGHITLIEVEVEKEILAKEETILDLEPKETISIEEELPLFSLDDDTVKEDTILDLDTETSISLEKETPEDENALFDLLVEEDIEEAIKEEVTKEVVKESVEEPIQLFVEDEERFEAETLEQIETPETDEILVDIDSISQKIGISHEDYDAFLDEYIDTALELEGDLQSSESEKRANATATLSNLGEVLQLPVIGSILEEINVVPESEVKGRVESFYSALSRLTTSQTSTATPESEPELDLFDAGIEVAKSAPEAPVAEVPVNENSFGTVSLEGIKPIHFDFQLEEAANDLSLPVELIEEFVHDFIDQAHIETKKMLKAYEEGDLDAIQKIGHLLKGASSNLRINPLSDTLYEIQFCEDPSKLEAFIKEYWGHFLSFEIQINALAK